MKIGINIYRFPTKSPLVAIWIPCVDRIKKKHLKLIRRAVGRKVKRKDLASEWNYFDGVQDEM